MSEEKLKLKYQLFTDVWRLYRKWVVLDSPMRPEEWKQLHTEAHEIVERYDYEKMSRHLLLAIIEEIEVEDNGKK